MMETEIYVVDDEAEIRASIAQFLSLENIECQEFEEGSALLNTITRDSNVVVISDIRMPNMDGMEVLSKVKAIDPTIPVILITGHGDVVMAVEAMQKGAYDFIEKPFDPERLLSQVKRAADARKLALSNRELRNALANPERLQNIFIGHSSNTEEIRERILDYAQSDDHILIQGEIGTGRSLAARAIHAASSGARNPFHIINCAAVSEEELAQRLFDDASNALINTPNPMTIILDDVGALSDGLQLRLAKALSKFEDDERPHIRVIGIETLPREKELNKELFYQIGGKTLHILPLRERSGDILTLFNWHLDRYCSDYGYDVPDLTADASATLMTAPWPGNIRQLMKFAENAAMKTGNGQTLEDVVRAEFSAQSGELIAANAPLKAQVDAFEEMLIRNALKRHRGSIAAVLEELALPRRTLNEKMARYGLSRADFT